MDTSRGRFRGGTPGACPLCFLQRYRVPNFVWAPQAKRMHQIVQIDFENYNFSPLLRGHIPLRHPLSHRAPKFCQSLNLALPLCFKILDPPPGYSACDICGTHICMQIIVSMCTKKKKEKKRPSTIQFRSARKAQNLNVARKFPLLQFAKFC